MSQNERCISVMIRKQPCGLDVDHDSWYLIYYLHTQIVEICYVPHPTSKMAPIDYAKDAQSMLGFLGLLTLVTGLITFFFDMYRKG